MALQRTNSHCQFMTGCAQTQKTGKTAFIDQ
jgi:hypothetical protein